MADEPKEGSRGVYVESLTPFLQGRAQLPLPVPRQSTTADADALLGLFASCQVELGIPAVFIGDEGLQWVRERSAKGWFWIAEIDSAIAAAMLLVPPGLGFVDDTTVNEVVYVIVRPESRGLRLGTGLIAYAKTRHAGLVAQSKVSNAVSRRMLERAEFVQGGGPDAKGFITYYWARKPIG